MNATQTRAPHWSFEWAGRALLDRAIRPDWFEPLIAQRPVLGWIAVNFVVGTLYVVFGVAVSWYFAAFGFFPSPIWLSASIALAAAMVGGVRVVPALFAASWITNSIIFGADALVVTIISLTNAAGPVLGALLVARHAAEGRLFDNFQGLFAFLAGGVVLHGTVVATGGTLAIWAGAPGIPSTELWSIWLRWWISDAGGALYFSPALLLWLSFRHARSADRLPGWEGLGVTAVTLGATALLFGQTPGGTANFYPPYLLILPLTWLALRLSLRSAYTLFTLVMVVATVCSVAGLGPFVAGGFERPLTALGGMLTLFSVNLLLISALVTEQRAAQSETAAKSAFLATLSHELRTPLHAMLGLTEVIRDDAQQGSPTRRHAAMVLDSGRHLLNLVEDLLDASKIRTGHYRLAEEDVELGTLALGCVILTETQAQKARVQIKEDSIATHVRVRADPRAVRQVLANLLSNAVKFTPAGGEVTLTLGVDDKGAYVRVADNGIGMTRAEVARAFDLFWQANMSNVRPSGGSGLGLTIGRQLMALHGGTLELASEPGRGTVATMRFPSDRVIAR
ncbi:MAG: ATP-binding protein [Alphaproteobacteria bacterium]